MKDNKTLSRTIFGAYCALMLYLLFFQRTPHLYSGRSYLGTMWQNLNYVPLDTIRRFVRLWNSPVYAHKARVNLIGNVVMFLPLGFCLPWAHKRLRSFWKVLLLSAALIVCVESIQLVTLLGHCDVDDLILNLIGVVIGYIFWQAVSTPDFGA